jgi:hypothetical protein
VVPLVVAISQQAQRLRVYVSQPTGTYVQIGVRTWLVASSKDAWRAVLIPGGSCSENLWGNHSFFSYGSTTGGDHGYPLCGVQGTSSGGATLWSRCIALIMRPLMVHSGRFMVGLEYPTEVGGPPGTGGGF